MLLNQGEAQKYIFQNRITYFRPFLTFVRVLNVYEISHVTLERSIISIILWEGPIRKLFYNFSYLCQSLTLANGIDRND